VPVLYNFKDEDMRWVHYRPKAKMRVLDHIFPDGIHVPDFFFGKNVVHLPTTKCHIYTTTTGAMKNAFGGLLNTRRHYTHSWIHETLVDLLAIQKEIHSGLFAIMDGTTAGDGPGPRTMRPVVKNVMLAAEDQVANDAVAAKMMGFDPLSIPYIRLAHDAGLGVGDPRDIEITGDVDAAAENWKFSVGKNLVRIGGGSLKAVVVFCVLGLAAYATLRGLVAVARVASVDTLSITLPTSQDLPSLLAHATGLARSHAIVLLSGGTGLALLTWVLARPEGRSRETWLGGLGIGACVVAVWWISGRLGHLVEHPGTLEEGFLATNSRGLESLNFVAPIADTLDWLILYSDASQRLTIGIVAVVGVIVGSWAVALAGGRFRWEGFAGVEDTALHLLGATLMGVGGVTALGCTVGQGLSGLSTLSIGSVIAVAGIVGGALAALHWQQWRLMRADAQGSA
jgi:hypothetical protein